MKLPLADVVVFHDELDLAAGKVRVKLGGGVAGHNGLRSADACLGSREFRRVRIGIGHPGHKDRVTGHVLCGLPQGRPGLARAAARRHRRRGTAARQRARMPPFMSRVALLTQPPKPEAAARPDTAREPD